DFGNINDIGKTTHDYTAQGVVNTTCNNGLPYSIYLGDGNNRIAGGFRQMTNGSGQYIPYQLYQNSNYSAVWDTTGGV
ncbi:spore coat protein U domain-containing protein, partial [Acinetobacter baumannii]